MPLCLQPPPKGCNCFLWFSSFLQTRWRGLSHFLAANQRDLVIVWGSGKCVLAELVGKKKKKKPSQLYSAFARIVPLCMCDSGEELFGNKAPRRQTTPWAAGDETGMGWMLFQIAFPPKYFSNLSFCIFFFFMQYFPWCRREFNLEQIITLNATYIFEIFTFGF